ncbi:MAG: hypothetical protein WC480_02030 [Patescibacteria group bacterium]
METINNSTPGIKLNSLYQLFGATWTVFTTHLKPLLLISLFTISPAIANQILLSIFGEQPPRPIGLISSILIVLSIATSIWGSIALITFLKENGQLNISDAFNKNANLFWAYLWLMIIVSLIVLGGFVLLIIPGIIWAIYFCLASYSLVCEGIRGYAAAKRSKQLVKGYWWAVFGRLFLLGLTLIAIFFVFSPFIILGEIFYSIFILIISVLITPFSTIYSYQIYLNLKAIKGN